MCLAPLACMSSSGLGLNIIVGLSGQLVLGYIAFFAIGAYTMALLNAPEPHNLMWGFWPALFLGLSLLPWQVSCSAYHSCACGEITSPSLPLDLARSSVFC